MPFWTTLARRSILCLGLVLPATALTQDPSSLRRGINAYPWLYDARSVDNKGQSYFLDQTFPYAKEYTLKALTTLKGMGLDFIRIHVEPNAFLTTDASQRGKLISQILDAVDLTNEARLTAIVTFTPNPATPDWQATAILQSTVKKQLYEDTLVELAEDVVKSKKNNVVLELMNEPPGGWSRLDMNLWLPTQEEYLKAVRRVAPELPIVVSGDKSGTIDGLLRLDPAELKDGHLYFSFHYYDPMLVTHQGAASPNYKYRVFLSGIPYPPVASEEKSTLTRIHDNIFKGISDHKEADTVWDQAETAIRQYFETQQGEAKILADFSRVTAWARSNHIQASRILLGEFGVYRPAASKQTVINYLHDVRVAAEQDGFPWAVYNYSPNKPLPNFQLFLQPGPNPPNFDPEIVKQGLGLSMPTAIAASTIR